MNRPKRQKRPADELGERYRRCPEFAGPVAVVVKLRGKFGELCERTPVLGKSPKVFRSPCGMSASPQTARSSASGPGRERLVERAERGEEERSGGVEHGSVILERAR